MHALCGLRSPPTYLDNLGKKPRMGDNGVMGHTRVSCSVGPFEVVMESVCRQKPPKFEETGLDKGTHVGSFKRMIHRISDKAISEFNASLDAYPPQS